MTENDRYTAHSTTLYTVRNGSVASYRCGHYRCRFRGVWHRVESRIGQRHAWTIIDKEACDSCGEVTRDLEAVIDPNHPLLLCEGCMDQRGQREAD